MEELQNQITELQVQNRHLKCLIEAFLNQYSGVVSPLLQKDNITPPDVIRSLIYDEAYRKHTEEESELGSHRRK